MSRYLLIFLAGFAGSLHCVGMCGGFACVMGPDRRGHMATVLRHLSYNIGRVMTYCFMGALVGYLGAQIIHGWDETSLAIAQRVLAFLSGALMILIGLQFFGIFQRLNQGAGIGGQLFIQALRDLLKHPSPFAPLAFGVANGFLPCPLVFAFVIQASASGGPLSGFLIMAAMGLGTLPAMFLMGGLGARFRSKPRQVNEQAVSVRLFKGDGTGVWQWSNWRLHGVRIAGVFIILLGLITIGRGVLPIGTHIHTL